MSRETWNLLNIPKLPHGLLPGDLRAAAIRWYEQRAMGPTWRFLELARCFIDGDDVVIEYGPLLASFDCLRLTRVGEWKHTP